MSLINTMLQDLDRRSAMAQPDGATPRQVRPVSRASRRGEWFWRVLALLMGCALAWVGWVAWQLQPRAALATPEAYVAEHRGLQRMRAAAEVKKVAEPVIEKVIDLQPVAQPVAAPIVEQPIKPVQKKRVTIDRPKAEKPRIERQERTVTPGERAEAEFRAAVQVLKQGRTAQAEEGFHAALQLDPAHRSARQALVALYMERGQLESARRLLEEGLQIDPAQPDFSVALARILVERKDFAAALAALQTSAAAASGHADHHFMRATVLQRLTRHQEAAEAYRSALQVHDGNPRSWIGLGISLEALQQRPEAAEAFKRALASGPVEPGLKSFAEQRLRALR